MQQHINPHLWRWLLTALASTLVLGFVTPARPAGAATATTATVTPTVHYDITCAGTSCPSTTTGTTGIVNGTAALSGIIGDRYSVSGSGGETITLTRRECYIFFCTTDYQAHLAVSWSWNVMAYGGVVFNVGTLMWADHLKATFSADLPQTSSNSFTYCNPILYSCSAFGGYAVNGVMTLHQCVPLCIQSETVLAWFHAHDDGSWVADINHS